MLFFDSYYCLESDALFYILGTEPMIFKTKFVGWNDVIAVDFTRTADSVRKTGADLGKWASEQQTKVKLFFFLLRFFFFLKFPMVYCPMV